MEISLKKIIFVQDISNAKLMEFKKLIDRGAELERMNEALHREDTQFIVIYGRRRIGKSELIKRIVKARHKAIVWQSVEPQKSAHYPYSSSHPLSLPNARFLVLRSRAWIGFAPRNQTWKACPATFPSAYSLLPSYC